MGWWWLRAKMKDETDIQLTASAAQFTAQPDADGNDHLLQDFLDRVTLCSAAQDTLSLEARVPVLNETRTFFRILASNSQPSSRIHLNDIYYSKH